MNVVNAGAGTGATGDGQRAAINVRLEACSGAELTGTLRLSDSRPECCDEFNIAELTSSHPKEDDQ